MKLKRVFPMLMMAGTLAVAMPSCNSKVSDADLKAKVETIISSHQGITTSVKDGVVTLEGFASSDTEKTQIETDVKAADKSIKSVVNNIVVETVAPAQITVNTVDESLAKGIVDATKDFPTVKATVKDGIISVTGSIEKAKLVTLKQALDNLHPKKVDLSAVTTK
ncbi:BON domain-containing protein [Sphingobacterium sp. SRCM116780]|uniref:BON domain-containing protein n=1 Tax=Sphingobacterium sp. SRCM116780 TaxID=2907623 RepID=UPI001F19FB5E|nr:BON domain-containing protein [Sphingobacterium sp. SRCM116780]UIR56776.1 BON domain-containing protein [Sphingobacterium sp. SRCM116780]